MKTLITLLAIIPMVAFASCGSSSNNFCKVKVLSVYDGDTFHVKIDKLHPIVGARLGIRVYGVNTPELRTKSIYEKTMAKKARDFTRELINNSKRVDLVDCKKGKYFRLVCKVEIDGKSLSDQLINNGLGVEYLK